MNLSMTFYIMYRVELCTRASVHCECSASLGAISDRHDQARRSQRKRDEPSCGLAIVSEEVSSICEKPCTKGPKALRRDQHKCFAGIIELSGFNILSRFELLPWAPTK